MRLLMSLLRRLVMDSTNRESISAAKKVVQEKSGRLHILVNKCATFKSSLAVSTNFGHISAGQTGPLSKFFNDLSAPQHQSPETLGQAMFENESFEGWADLYTINSSSIFFVTMAFLGLLAKGSEDRAGYTSCVINISSISGSWKLAQNHVCA